jgi:hypothetical protein
MSRLLYLDENLPLRLAEELTARGRPAQALRHDPTAPVRDEELLRHVGDAVLVTTQARIPREPRATVAVVHAQGEDAKRETVHRWAHAMATQPKGSMRRYSPHRRGR